MMARSAAGSVARKPPATLTITSCPASSSPARRVRHRRQHDEAVVVHAVCHPSRGGKLREVGKRLHLQQQGAGAFEHRRDDGAQLGPGPL